MPADGNWSPALSGGPQIPHSLLKLLGTCLCTRVQVILFFTIMGVMFSKFARDCSRFNLKKKLIYLFLLKEMHFGNKWRRATANVAMDKHFRS